MFSVPGWNLSAPLATQVEKPKPRDPTKEGKKAKKRKRKQEEEIDEGNVGEYWDKIVEGKPVKGVEQSVTDQNGEAQVGDGATEKRGKKRKRKDIKEAEVDVIGDKDASTGKKDTEAIAKTPTMDDGLSKHDKSKRDKKKRKKDQKLDRTPRHETSKTTGVPVSEAPVSLLPPEPKGLTPLQKSMRNKLAGARFRHLNETLYTKPSADSLSLFKEDPSMFEDYHRGFAQQVDVWPENPVDVFLSTIITRGKMHSKDPWKDKKRKDKKATKGPPPVPEPNPAHTPQISSIKPLPRNLKGHSTLADLGCGTASLAYRLQPHLKPLNLTIHSFDLSKPPGPSAPLVTVADISALPVPSGSIDIAIFCLALMGTNWLDFIDEAYRILRWRGELWISEIKSRFGRVERRKAGRPLVNSVGSLKKPDKKVGGKKKEGKVEEGIAGSDDEAELAERVDGGEGKEGTDVSAFVEVLRKHGFVLDAPPERPGDAVDLSNKMFVKMQFTKSAQPVKGKNAQRNGERDAGRGGLKMGIKGKKFTAVTADEDGADEGMDAKVLKPCLYKIR